LESPGLERKASGGKLGGEMGIRRRKRRRCKMGLEKHTFHQRLQEYCNCYVGTDPKEELLRLSMGGEAADFTGDLEEAAIKLLGLMILYGLKENAKSIELRRTKDGRTRIDVSASGNYQLPGPPRNLFEKAMDIARAISHIEGSKGQIPLALGLGQDSIELLLTLERSQEDLIAFSLPQG
jgi:hypothetical protein